MLLKSPEPDRPEPLWPPSTSRGHWITLAFAVIILTPSMIGFVMKFSEFIHTFQDSSEGAFAITPMVNYLFASLGFLCLLLWSAVNGMFHDMEEPKRLMLQRERMLDENDEQLRTDRAGYGAHHVD